jgi:phosphatidylglycerol:prolipoprotein diacylglycerol transferase
VGCFLNGCCAGRPSDSWLAFKLPNCEGVWRKRIPNQLLEALCAAVLLSAATILWKRMPFPGALFLAIVLGYSTVRFGMEFLRERKSAGVFTTGHAVSAISVLVAATMLAVYWTK